MERHPSPPSYCPMNETNLDCYIKLFHTIIDKGVYYLALCKMK